MQYAIVNAICNSKWNEVNCVYHYIAHFICPFSVRFHSSVGGWSYPMHTGTLLNQNPNFILDNISPQGVRTHTHSDSLRASVEQIYPIGHRDILK